MRHLVKPEGSEPVRLKTKGAEETKKNVQKYLQTPKNKRTSLSFNIKKSIYDGNVEKRKDSERIKNLLLRIQNNTCCYCESKFRATSSGDIEHYRPKGAFKQNKGDKDAHSPGYFWLGYDWNNLMVSCEGCNRATKNDLFPLKNPNVREKVFDTLDVSIEEPLLLNPYEEEHPENHLTFVGCIEAGTTEEGKATIDICQLYREDLKNEREERLNLLNALKQIYENSKGTITEKKSKEIFYKALKDSLDRGTYTLMIRCNFRKYLPDVLKVY